MTISARGFAIVEDGKIDMLTVYPHARGAVVNWLASSTGLVPTQDCSDERVFAMWDANRGSAEVCPVVVAVQRSAVDD